MDVTPLALKGYVYFMPMRALSIKHLDPSNDSFISRVGDDSGQHYEHWKNMVDMNITAKSRKVACYFGLILQIEFAA